MVEQTGRTGVVEGGARRPGWVPSWGLVIALALLAGLLWMTASQSDPPPPKPKEVPLTEFSAGRAGEILTQLVGDGAPHYTGSAANARVRERILSHLRWLGLTPEVQETVACGGGGCARVWNILARLEGRERGKAVLLMAHYDSVPSGPGVSDDLTGVAAILEIARILKTGEPPRNPVMLLFTDAEELLLLGAQAFATQHPAANDVGVVVNLEARGSSGPSLMFETSGSDALAVAAYAERATKPFTSSLFPTLYEILPNDTDLSVFKRRGVPGMNFAFIENPTHYHTPLDNLENASPASLQHHGDNALAAVRGLAEADLSRPLTGKAVFFDLFHSTVVRWPAGISPVLGLAALVLTLAAVFLSIRRRAAAWKGVIRGLVVSLAAVAFALMAGFALQALLAAVFAGPWAARPMWAILAFWLLGLLVAIGTAALLTRQLRIPGLWGGVWLFWSILGLLLSLTLPGISYLFLVPAVVAGLCGLLLGRSPAGWTVAAVIPVLVAAVLWFPILLLLYAGLGVTGLLLTAVLLALVLTSVIPLVPDSGSLGGKWLPLAAVAGLVVATVMAMISPAFTPDSPRNVVLQVHQDADTGATQWLVRAAPPLPPDIRKAGQFESRPRPPFPWSPPVARSFVSPGPKLNVPAPELTVVSDTVANGKRQLRLRLRSPRGAEVGSLFIPAEARLESVRIDGQAVPMPQAGAPRPGGGPGPRWLNVSSFTLPPQGSEFEIVLGNPQPAEWYVLDRSFNLPPSAQPLAAARPKDAVTVNDGDGTLVSRKVRI